MIVYLAILASLTVLTYAATCDQNATECEIWLEVGFKLTMMDRGSGVTAKSGKLYYIDNNTVVTNTSDIVSADGYDVTKLVIVVNGTLPGPAIEVYEGQTVIIHVKNNLPSESTSIHWHGLHQRGTSWMDGVAFVNQCPILPSESFTYRFTASPKGTFWYHSHIGLQRSMGLYGPLIVYEKDKNPELEHTLMITDYNHDTNSNEDYFDMLFGLYINGKRRGLTQSLDGAKYSMFNYQSGLINGKGRIEYPDGSNNGAPLSVFEVMAGKTYRFRVINAGKEFPFRISVDGHILVLIGSDGFPLNPQPTESVIVQPGERYDVQIVTANINRTNYWIRAQTLEVGVLHTARAILRYEGAEDKDPESAPTECLGDNPCSVINCPFKYYPIDEHRQCIAIDELKAPQGDPPPGVNDGRVIEEIFLNFGFPGTRGRRPGSVNGRSLRLPPVSALTQPQELGNYTCSDEECGEQKICKCMHSLTLEHNKVYQLILLNMGNGNEFSHPVHMHGHAYYVMKMGFGDYDETTGRLIRQNADIDCAKGLNISQSESFCNNAQWRNSSWFGNDVPDLELDTPPRKDTIIVPMGGYVVVRIIADNPGLWYMHCHIEFHNMGGMAILLNESFPEQRLNEVPSDFPRCGDVRLTSGTKGCCFSYCNTLFTLLLYLSIQFYVV